MGLRGAWFGVIRTPGVERGSSFSPSWVGYRASLRVGAEWIVLGQASGDKEGSSTPGRQAAGARQQRFKVGLRL